MTTDKQLEMRIAELEAKQAQSAALLEISRELSLAKNEDELLAALSRPARSTGVCMALLTYVYSDDRGKPDSAEIAAVWSLDGQTALPEPVHGRFRLEEIPATQMWFASRNAPVFLIDIDKDERFDAMSRNLFKSMGWRAAVAISLSQAKNWIGVLTFYWAEPHQFEESESSLYAALADLAGPIVHTRRLMNSLREAIAGRDEQQLLLRGVLDASPDLIFFKDNDSVYRLCNEAFAHFHDREVNDLVGMGVFDLWPPEEAQFYRSEDLRVLGGAQTVAEHVVDKPSGRHYFESIKAPLRSKSGDVLGLIAFERNITDRKQAEMALASERSLLRTLIDALPDHVYAKDTEGRYMLVNLAQARSLGYEDPDDVAGKTDFDVNPEELARQYQELDQMVIQSGEIARKEEPFQSAQGDILWVYSVKVPLRNAEGKIFGLVGVSRDITQQKLLEEKAERERLQQQIIEAQKRAIQELSTPIIPIMDRVIVMPLIGSIDTLRSKEVMRALLTGISEYRARVVILDITGVPIVDSGVASHLNKTIQAARLKGAHTIVTGISDAVAETVVELGLDWSGIETLDNLQTGLLTALGRLGIRLSKVG